MLASFAVAASALPARAASLTHNIAIALPLSGPQSALGAQIRAAVELALAAYAAQMRRGSPTLKVTYYDDRCSADGGLAAAEAIMTDTANPPVAVVGHACPSAAAAATPVYARAGLVHIIAGSLPAREPQTARRGPLQFRLPADGAQGSLMGQALVAAGPDARIAFVRDKTLFAGSALKPTAAALAAAGRRVPVLETFAGGEKDFAGLAQRLKVAGITHIALAAFPSEAALLVAEVRRANPDVMILATDQLADPVFQRQAGAAAEGVHVAFAPDARAYPGAMAVAAALAAQGLEPSRAALASHAAVEVIAALLAANDGLDARALTTHTATTILGPVSFDPQGTASLPSHVVYTWRDGQLLPPPTP